MAAKSSDQKSKPKKRRKVQRDDQPVVYCLEGVWRQDDDQRTSDSSVKPCLDFLKINELWDVRHRDVATADELKWYIQNEWAHCRPDSILYLATHGWDEGISLSEGNDIFLLPSGQSDSNKSLVSMLESIATDNVARHIHFGGCAVMADHTNWTDTFHKRTGMTVISGFKADNVG